MDSNCGEMYYIIEIKLAHQIFFRCLGLKFFKFFSVTKTTFFLNFEYGHTKTMKKHTKINLNIYLIFFCEIYPVSLEVPI